MSKKLVLGLNDCTNEEYHADREWASSSVLKVALKDIADYHKQYVLGQPKTFGNSASLEFGSLVHTMILEPHLLDKEYAFFSGWKRMGADFEAFKAANPGKKIITQDVKGKADLLVKQYKRNPKAVELFSGGFAEQTICVEIEGMKIKTRFDYIRPDLGIIPDVKTTADSSDVETFKLTIDRYLYQLSGALYCMAAEIHYGKPFNFYYKVLSKKDNTCDLYKTSAKTMIEGKKMVMTAIKKIQEAQKTGIWVEKDFETSKPMDPREYEILEV